MSARVSIPGNVRRMIQDIKEIASNNTDEEVYAMLKDCAMDPNETAQRLLLQDTFHEVKRKRDKRKEGNREVPDSRWRPGLPGRGGRGGRGNYSSRHLANDASGGKNVGTGKEYGVSQGTEKGNAPAAAVVHDAEIKSPVPIEGSVGALANGPSSVESSISFQGTISQASSVTCMKKIEESSSTGSSKTGTSVDTTSSSPSGQPFPGSDQLPSSMRSASVSGICASASDPVLVPNLDARAPGTLGTIKREAGSQRTVEKTINKVVSHDVADSELSSISNKVSSDMEKYYMHGKSQGKSPRFEGNQLLDAPHDTSSSTISSSMGSRPSSNYSSRSQQLNAPQRVGPNKEWKPKTTHTNPAQASGVPVTSDVISAKVEAVDLSLPSISSTASDDGASKLQKKLEELHVSDTKHVIIPNHLQVPESERSGLSFGSFDASFALGFGNDRDGNKSPTPLSEASQETEENVDEPLLSIQVASSTADEASYPDDPQSLTQKSEHLSPRGVDISSRVSTVQEYDQSKPEPSLAPEGAQPSVVHSTPTYPTFGLVPQMLGSQFAAFEGTESQPRDASRLPSFVVQQPFDPSTSYYTQFYRPPMDGDGRFSPFLASGAATKYNGNITVLPAQAGQSPPENGNALVLSTTGPTPVVTQGGVMQNSIPVTQQAVPLFRQPAGVHISHYHHNYIPYSQYISPFFVPPATIHPFVSNTAFPQQAPTGGILSPPAPAASATPVKYTIPQFKPGNIAGNSTLVGMPTGYGVYNSTPAGYSTNHTATSANSTSNEDLNASQFKENIYITGQQNEGSAVWIPTPGRDIPALQAGSFYNLAPQGQHMSFASSQAGHGAFTGIYHPTQTVAAAAVHSLLPQSQPMAGAIEMVGPPAGVYQQPQRAQVNWTNNY